MPTPYDLLTHQLADRASPFTTLVLQIGFILYLLLGQFALLLLWRLCIPARPASRLGTVLFALYLLAGQVVLLFAWPRLLAALLVVHPATLLADLVVIFHLSLVLVVVLALPLILVGGPLGWSWVRNFWFRLVQLLVIEIVAGQAVVAIECPLTTIERPLRGGMERFHELDNATALGAACHRALFYDFELHQFLILYVSVGGLALLTWILVPPRVPWAHSSISR